jgi:putative transposase
MVSQHKLSERHACTLVGLSRDSYRHPSAPSALNEELRQKIVQTAHERRRWGYRMIHDVLRPEYPGINHKRVYRLYSQQGLAIRKRKKTKRTGVRVPLVAATAVNQTWSMDFVSDAIARPGAVARRIKCLTVADDFSHECVDIAVDFGLGGHYVTRILDRAAQFRGYPEAVRTDNGPEFTCRAFMT